MPSTTAPSNADHWVVITGVGKRVGYQLALHFLDQGFHVFGTYRTHYESIDELQAKGAMLVSCDLYDLHSVETVIGQVEQHCNSLAAIIHNASDWLPDDKLVDTANTDQAANACHHLQQLMQIHTAVPYLVNRRLAPKLKSYAEHNQCTADIIHFTDYVVDKGSKKHMAYAASKAALHNLTLSFASALAPHIKVNSIAPALLKFNPNDDSDYQAKAKKKSLLQKEGGLKEACEAVAYVLNSDYVTGRTLHLDGGRHLV